MKERQRPSLTFTLFNTFNRCQGNTASPISVISVPQLIRSSVAVVVLNDVAAHVNVA